VSGVTDQLRESLTTALGAAYTIERELAGGGMSRVFVAREHALGREVVVKVLPPELSAGINRERFRREVQLAAQLSHPYIVPLLHAGEAGELLWFTMPFIRGTSLKERLELDGPLGVRETVRFAHDVVEALAYAHSRGVIHRDIKPGNILTDGHHAMVTDFGVAKALGAALPFTGVAGHTTSGMAIGTPAYMAPEQLAADPSADHRVDLYAVGLLMYELLAGVSPFNAASPTATMTAQLTRTPESLHRLRGEVPPALADLVARCLAKQPEDRPPDAATVLAALEKITGEMVVTAHRESTGEKAQRSGRGPSWPVLAGAGAVLALVAGGLWATRAGWNGGTATPTGRDTLVVVAPRDDATDQPFASAKPMTRADSLAIAAALRDELERIDPQEVSRRAGTSTTGVEVSLDRQLAIADSLVRAKLSEISVRSAALGTRDRSGEPGRFAGTVITAAPGSEVARRVMILSTPPRDSDAALTARGDSLAQMLRDRVGRSDAWELVAAPTGGRLVTPEGAPPDADILMTVGVSPAGTDSVRLRVGIRNLEPGSSFGYRVIASNPVAIGDAGEAFRSTLRDAMGTLESLRRVSRGETWQLDMGRRAGTPPAPPSRGNP
jgi:serine/threonine-protein kinase